MCVEEANKYRVIDVGCGDRFTVIITSGEHNREKYNLIKKFNDGVINHAHQQITKIRDFQETRLKHFFEKRSSQQLDSRGEKLQRSLQKQSSIPSFVQRSGFQQQVRE